MNGTNAVRLFLGVIGTLLLLGGLALALAGGGVDVFPVVLWLLVVN